MTVTKPPRAPSGLGSAGAVLWRTLCADYKFTNAEQVRVVLACRQADAIAELETQLASDGLMVDGAGGRLRLSAIPAELRQSRGALSKLLVDLRLPDAQGVVSLSERSLRAKRGADSRWSRVARDNERRGA